MTVQAEETKRPFAAIADLLRSRAALDAAAKNADDDEDKKKDAKAEDDEDKKDAKGKKAGDDDEDEDKKKKDSKSARSVVVGVSVDDDDDDDDDDDKDKKKSKKKGVSGIGRLVAEGGDNTSDIQDEQDSVLQQAREAERGRIRAILNCAAASVLPDAAMHLALETSTARANAIGLLKAMAAAPPPVAAAAKGESLRQRMANVDVPIVGAGDERTSPDLAAQIILAGKKRRGEI